MYSHATRGHRPCRKMVQLEGRGSNEQQLTAVGVELTALRAVVEFYNNTSLYKILITGTEQKVYGTLHTKKQDTKTFIIKIGH